MGPIRKFTFAFACLTFFLMGNLWGLLPSIGNVLTQSPVFNLKVSEYAFLGLVLITSAIFFALFTGFFGKKIGMKIFLLGSVFSFILASGFYSMYYYKQAETNFWLLLSGQLFLGIGIGGVITSLSSYISFLIPNKTPILLTAIYSFTNFGSCSMPLIFHLYFNDTNWMYISVAISIVASILFFLGLYILPDIKNPRAHPNIATKIPGRFCFFLALIFSYAIVENSIDSWAVIYLNQARYFSVGSVNLGLSIFWGIVGIGQILICFSLRWIKPSTIYRILPFLLVVGYYGLVFSNRNLNEIGFFIISGLGCSAFFALSMSFVENKFPGVTEIATGLMVISYFVGTVFNFAIFWFSLKFLNFQISHIFIILGFFSFVLVFITNYIFRKFYTSL